MTLGSVAQMRIAYTQASGALAWFVFAYQEIAQWRASVERLSTFAEVVDASQADLADGIGGIRVTASTGSELELVALVLRLPDGRVLLDKLNASIAQGARVAVLGAAGAGRTTLFRA